MDASLLGRRASVRPGAGAIGLFGRTAPREAGHLGGLGVGAHGHGAHTLLAAKAARKRGWASERHKQYRPLGTPDLERAKLAPPMLSANAEAGLGGVSAGFGAASGGVGAQQQTSGSSRSPGGAGSPRDEQDSGGAHGGGGVGYTPRASRDLFSEVQLSQKRVRGCRAGASFAEVGRMLERKEARKASRRAKQPQWRPVRLDMRLLLPRLVGKVGAAGAANRALAAAEAASKAGGGGAAAQAVIASHALESSSGALLSDPAAAITGRLHEWELAYVEQERRLGTALAKCKEERSDHYRRKFRSFAVRGAAGFDAERWRLEAERCRIEQQLVAVDRHKWYSRLLAVAPAAAAVQVAAAAERHLGDVVGHGSSAALSPSPRRQAHGPLSGEAKILLAVRSRIEAGAEFGVDELVALVSTITRDELDSNDVQKLLIIIKDELGMPVDAFRRIFNAHSLPVPYLLKREQAGLTLGKEGIAARTPAVRVTAASISPRISTKGRTAAVGTATPLVPASLPPLVAQTPAPTSKGVASSAVPALA